MDYNKRTVQRAYNKLTPKQQEDADCKAKAADKAAKAYAAARDNFHKLGMVQERAYDAWFKALGMLADGDINETYDQ